LRCNVKIIITGVVLGHTALSIRCVAGVGTVTAEITMLSVDNAHVVNAGEAVSFDCRFHADRSYNLFDYPVLWRKSQLENIVDESSGGQGLEPGNGDFLQVSYRYKAPNNIKL